MPRAVGSTFYECYSKFLEGNGADLPERPRGVTHNATRLWGKRISPLVWKSEGDKEYLEKNYSS
jgi:hypothetical protein